MSKFIDIAKEYIKTGLSAVATDTIKIPVNGWKAQQERFLTDQELKEKFSSDKAKGVGIVCGKISGNLEVLDIDCKYDITGTLFDDLMQAITDVDSDMAQSMVVAKTQSGGYHLYYRCTEIEGNKKFAQRYTTDKEREKNPHEQTKVLLESRGEGGYVVAPTTPGYEFITGNVKDIKEITPDQRRVLHEVARSFNQVIEEVRQYEYSEKETFNKSPFNDYNERGDVVALLKKHGWNEVWTKGPKVVFLRPGETKSKSSGDFNTDINLFSVFTTSTQFEPQKGYKPSAVFCKLECNDDWSLCAKKLNELGFGEPYKKIPKNIKKTISKLTEKGIEGEELTKEVAKKHSISLDEAKSVIRKSSKKDVNLFWSWDELDEKLSLVYTRFVEFLNKEGFGLYFYDKTSPVFKVVRCVDNLLEETTTERIKKHVEYYIRDYNLDGAGYSHEMLLEIIYRDQSIFSKNILDFLRPIEIEFLEDTKEICYIPFKKGIVKITKSGVDLINHGDVNKVIWRQDLIDFDITIDINDENDCEFLTFVENITDKDTSRLQQALSIIGYVLHKYKFQDRAYAVVLGEETDDDAKGGGTGKGIFTKCFEYMMPCVTVDGKTFNPGNKSFAYQRLKLNTKAMIIQDVVKKFDFHTLYALITEGATVEKKNQDELFIPYKDSPKIIITTNYTIPDDSNHAKRRLKVIEFSDHYKPEYTPADEFGHLLFTDWDQGEWNRFYNLMFVCVKYYLEKGVVDIPQSSSYKFKKIKSQFGEDFSEWFGNYFQNGCGNLKMVSELYKGFLVEHDLDTKDYSVKRFSKAIEISAKYMDVEMVRDRTVDSSRKVFIKLKK